MSRRIGLPFLLLALGAICMAYGLWRGEGDVLFNKAVHICMECIGLG